MKLPLSLALLLLLIFTPEIHSSTIEYRGVIRNSEGKAISNTPTNVYIEIISDTDSTEPLFTEQHQITTDSSGGFHILIGSEESNDITLEELNWDEELLLRVSTTPNGASTMTTISSIAYTPKSITSKVAGELQTVSSDGTIWKLVVNNVGDISWEKVTTDSSDDDETGDSVYDQSYWPDELYLVGNFCNWETSSSLKFTKLSDSKFQITTTLEPGYIFKFISEQSWNGARDWSGTSSEINSSISLTEWGNTPEFTATSGTYVIYIDFYNYIMKIYSTSN